METPNDVLTARSYRLLRKSAIIRTVVFLSVLSALLLVFFSLFGIARVNRTSMEPTLHSGNIVLIKKAGNDYNIGDVIVYRTPNGQKNVKRIVAVYGDTVNISNDGELIINGKTKEEPGIYTDTYRKENGVEFPYTVEEGKVFLLGDNRVTSIDSRNTGAISISDIIGKVLLSVEVTE